MTTPPPRRPLIDGGALDALLAVLRDGQRHEGRELLAQARPTGAGDQPATAVLVALVSAGAVRKFGAGMGATYRLALPVEEAAALLAPAAVRVLARIAGRRAGAMARLGLMLSLRADGLTMAEIGQRLGVSHQAVSQRLARHDRRPPAGADRSADSAES